MFKIDYAGREVNLPVIALSGTHSSGKTTLCYTLDNSGTFIAHEGARDFIARFGVDMVLGGRPEPQISIATTSIMNTVDVIDQIAALHRHNSRSPFGFGIVLDRTPMDAEAYAYVNGGNNGIADKFTTQEVTVAIGLPDYNSVQPAKKIPFWNMFREFSRRYVDFAYICNPYEVEFEDDGARNGIIRFQIHEKILELYTEVLGHSHVSLLSGTVEERAAVVRTKMDELIADMNSAE